MSDPNQKSPEEAPTEKNRQPNGPEAPPPGKRFQIILVQTIVFAAVFLTLLWLAERHSAFAAGFGLIAIAYLLAKKKPG